MRYEAFVGVRYLMGKRRTDVVSIITLISVAGVAVGVMAMIVVLSVMGGFEKDLKTKILGTKTHMVILGQDEEPIADPGPVLEELRSIPTVTGASSFVESEVMISSPTNLAGVLLKGIDPTQVQTVSTLETSLVDGDLSYLLSSDKIRPGLRGLSDPDELDRILDALEYEHHLKPLDGDDPASMGRHVPGVDGVVYTRPDGTVVVNQGAPKSSLEKYLKSDTPLRPGDVAKQPQYNPDDVGALYNNDDPDEGFMPPLPGQVVEKPKAPASPSKSENPTSPKDAAYDPNNVGTLYDSDDPDDGFMPPLPGQDGPSTVESTKPSLDPYDAMPARRTTVPGIIIGRELKKSLQVDIGSEVNIVSPQGDMGPSGPIPRSRPFKVVGIFYSGMYEYDTKYVYMSIPSAQDFLSLDSKYVTGIEVKTQNVENVSETKDVLVSKLTAVNRLEGLRIRDWKEMNSNLFFALKLEKIVMFIILVFIILVASFSIVCNLVMVVIEKAREIAILKSMGATNQGVMRIFILEGTIIGVAGTVIGLVLGVACCVIIEFYGIRLDPDVYYINTLPVDLDPLEVVLIALSGVAISALATVYPSIQASRLTPVDGLRYE